MEDITPDLFRRFLKGISKVMTIRNMGISAVSAQMHHPSPSRRRDETFWQGINCHTVKGICITRTFDESVSGKMEKNERDEGKN